MDKKVIFAVAGSGKTTLIINELTLHNRSLIVTYTNNNTENLRQSIIAKFGYFPSNITLLPYFTFLYSFCYKPFLSYKHKTKGITYERNPNKFANSKDRQYFFDKLDKIYSNRIAKFLEAQSVLDEINYRLSKYFDNLFIDEIQDLAGHDFNLLTSLSKAPLKITLVGDFYQHTFDTSRDGTVNKNLHEDYAGYKKLFTKMGMADDTKTLSKSYRCSPITCDFITKYIGISIQSHNKNETKVHLVDTEDFADEIFKSNEVIKLFLQEHYRYGCYSRNWGECKGEDKYDDICVVLNKTTLSNYNKGTLKTLVPQTKNKLYVACSRAKKDMYLVSDELYKKYKIPR